MGLFSFTTKLLGAAVAVVAAPVVLPVAGAALAAAGTAAAGAAAAAGTAVAGAATAAAGAATAAAGTVAAGAAAAGTTVVGAGAAAASAVGGAAVSTMAAVGTAVGTTASAVGLSSVAAATGTTAGAAAVGAIATSTAVGAQQAASAKKKLDKASGIKASAENSYNIAKTEFELKEQDVNTSIEKLSAKKKEVSEKLLAFNSILKKIENPSRLMVPIVKGEVCEKKDANINFTGYAIGATDWAEGLIKTYAGGQLAGVALGSVITSTITTAGTGAAISSLSGAAATNATMAALGGGTLASGGLGVAGGMMISSGLTFAPALAVGGLMLNSKAEDALEDARNLSDKVKTSVKQFDKIGSFYDQLTICMDTMRRNIDETETIFEKPYEYIHTLIDINGNRDAEKWSKTDEDYFYAGVCLAKVLELQCQKEFIKNVHAEEMFDKKNVVPVTEVKALSYDKAPVTLGNNKVRTIVGKVEELKEIARVSREESDERVLSGESLTNSELRYLYLRSAGSEKAKYRKLLQERGQKID